MIRNIAFDLGGVVIALNLEQAIRAFERIGMKDAREQLVCPKNGQDWTILPEIESLLTQSCANESASSERIQDNTTK